MSQTYYFEGKYVVISIPIKFKHRNGRKIIQIPDGPQPEQRYEPQDAIVLAIARAFLWQDLLESGKVKSIAALAETLSVDPAYIRRTLQLALLDPHIIRTILRGKEPSGLSLRKLVQPLPLDWDTQRSVLGIE
ncbi:MAG: hypothetical protein AB1454_13020 [Candidatus Auribacterota bacterium]